MKRYISASTEYLNGSYLVDRDGTIYTTILHVPSTTYLDRGLHHLAPTDAGFLCDIGKINEADVFNVITFCFVEYLTDVKHRGDVFKPSMLDFTEFSNWAELKYSSSAQKVFNSRFKDLNGSLSEEAERSFWKLDERWYTWLRNNFIKLSSINKIVEFRIQSTDKFDWNNTEEDPFFHSIGKYDTDPKGNKTFYDYSVDATVVAKRQNGETFFPVIESLDVNVTMLSLLSPVNCRYLFDNDVLFSYIS